MILETSNLYLTTAVALFATPPVARQPRPIIASDLCFKGARIC